MANAEIVYFNELKRTCIAILVLPLPMGLQYYPNPPVHNRTRFASNKSTHPQPQQPPILDPIPLPTHPIKILNCTNPSKACNQKKMSQNSTGQDRGRYYINHGNRNRVGSVGGEVRGPRTRTRLHCGLGHACWGREMRYTR